MRLGDYALFTDLRLLTRILRNLLSNACRYTERGSILLAARRRGEHLRLEIWDTGRGIAADRMESIFLEFNQLDVGRAADRKGSAWGWRSSSVSPASSATGCRCIRVRAVVRGSASRCPWPPGCRCPSASKRRSRVPATRCPGAGCWCWTMS